MKRALKICISAFIAILATAASLYSGPVRNGDAVYVQPDGSSFQARIRGDEWTRIRTTSDGCAIVKDKDGWWCYGIYGHDGSIGCTEFKVGKPAPASVITSSRNIPYGILSEKAAARRHEAGMMNAEVLRSIREANTAVTKSSPAAIQKKGIAILAQFQDVKFTYTKEDFHNLLNQEGYNGTGSAKDYYEDQFGEDWEFTFDVSEIVTLPNLLKYYGENDADDGNDLRPAEMIRDACRKADEEIDFSQYDQDGDGKVDNIYVFVAGHDEAENTDQTELIWSHQWYVYTGGGIRLTLDGVLIDRYACSSELSGRTSLTGIGTFCHEYAHTFGLPDFYDTNYDEDGAWAAGLWKTTSLMDGGNYNNKAMTPPNLNCVERKLLGLSEPVAIAEGNSYTLEPVHVNGKYFILNCSTEGEYYLFENRSNQGWDQYIGGKGLLVYHIDENGKENVTGLGLRSRWDRNTVNTDPNHQCVDLIEADSRKDDITNKYAPFNNIRGIFFPQTDVTAVTADGLADYRFWNGDIPSVSLTGITAVGDDIQFNTVNSTDVIDISDISGFEYQAYPDAIFMTFRSATGFVYDTAILEWRKGADEEYSSMTIAPSSDGTYSVLLDKLESGNTLYDIQIRFEYLGALGKTHQAQIMTKRSPAVTWPYLYMTDGGNVSRTEGLIAHVVNAEKAVSTEWFLDGKKLKIRNGCRIFPSTDGTLSCIVTWEDGSTDTITKEITLTEHK